MTPYDKSFVFGVPGIVTPAFNTDPNPNDFGITELDQINKIWQRVAEDYAPFNVNVTTINPGYFPNGVGLHVVIGGSWNDWYGGKPSSGTSSIGSFKDGMPDNVKMPNVVFVFSAHISSLVNGKNYDNAPIKLIDAVANTISHKSGHAFGLYHSPTFNANGTVNTNQIYSPGPVGSDWTPIMGDNLASDRTKWSVGTNQIGKYQDDMATLVANGLSERAADHGKTFPTADRLLVIVANPTITVQQASGLISKTTDIDYFTFTTSGGPMTFYLTPAAEGANLDSYLKVFRRDFDIMGRAVATLVGSAEPKDSLGATVSVFAGAGTYYVIVGSQGAYGDVDQYTLTAVTMNPNPNFPVVITFPPPVVLWARTTVATASSSSSTAINSQNALPTGVAINGVSGGAVAQGAATLVTGPSDSKVSAQVGRAKPATDDRKPSSFLTTNLLGGKDLCSTWLKMDELN